MGGEYGSMIIICPVCGESLPVIPKVHHIEINRYEYQAENSNIGVQWSSQIIYHHCKESQT